MTKHARTSIWGVLACVWPALGWAQASGEAADMGPGVAAAVLAAEPLPPRSSLWQAVDSVFRQRAGAPQADRRLTAEQRQELREQVRRAALRPDGELPARGTHVGQR